MTSSDPTSPEAGASDLQLFGDALPVAVALVVPRDATVIRSNAEFTELLGCQPGSLEQLQFTDLFAEPDRVRGFLRTAADGNPVTDVELEAKHGRGDDLVVLASFAVAKEPSESEAVVVVLHDVTGLSRLRGDLKERSLELEELARFPEMNPGPVLRLDHEGRVVLANAAARGIFGASDLVGRSWLEVCPSMNEKRWEEVLDGNSGFSLEAEIGDLTIVFAHVGDISGERFFVFGADVTDFRRTGQLLNETTRQLAEFARFPDMNPGPVLQLDLDASVLLANWAATDLFGDSLVGRSWRDICPDFDDAVWDEIVGSEDFVTLERPLDSQHFIFFHRADALSERVFVYGADVSEQRQADELIRLLLASTGEGIYGTDRDGICTFANPACASILGFQSDADVVGQDMHELAHHSRAHGERHPAEEGRIRQALIGMEGVHADDEVMWRADGSSFPAEYWSSPMKLDGELMGAVVTFVDITERKLVADELARARVIAEEASEAKSQFMANMSHELRTPMNAILGYSEMLMEDAEDSGDDAIADLSKINSAGRHLLDLINTVLDLSKIEAGQMDLNLETFDVSGMFADVSVVAQPLIETNGNRLVRDWDETLGHMHSDVTKIRQSLLNLLSNASKFSKDDVITLSARRRTIDDTDWICFRVSDNGIGIPEDKLEHVFAEFAQATSTTARDYGGTGLGLPVTRRLCRLLGGDVTLESTAGVGSTFTIELPVVAVVAPDISSHAPSPTVDADGSRPDVLVIDDDAHSRDLLARTLERDGYTVVTASSGQRGIEMARSRQPAFITLDIVMPNMDGWAVLTELKEDPSTAEIPVAMVSIAPNHEMGFLLGAVDSLAKPIDRDMLYEVVRRHVGTEALHVLVVDDDEPSRSLLRSYVEAAGWDCSAADNGVTALDQIRLHTPDLILLDLMMPEMNGFELLDELRSDITNRLIPIVVITAKDLTDDDRARLRGRVDTVIEKGQQTADEVLDFVRSALARPTDPDN